MTSIIRMLFLPMLFFGYLSNVVIAASLYPSPDDKKTIMAAEEAVKQLGKDRGAIPIDYKTVDIIGLEPVEISGKAIKVEEALKDLHAKMLGTEIQISLSGDVLFNFDKWEIRPEAEKTLYKIVKVIKELKKENVLIEGHTDSKGSDSYNLKLSQKRADSVKIWFLEKGDLNQVKLLAKGYGESRPVAPNTKQDESDNPQGRSKNRRVEIKIKK
jgi:outer membrane protein OmpA-like peptidoglycan-associated protein